MNLNQKLYDEKKKLVELRFEEYKVRRNITSIKNDIKETFIFNIQDIGNVLVNLLSTVTNDEYILDDCLAEGIEIEELGLERRIETTEVVRSYIMKKDFKYDPSSRDNLYLYHSSGKFLLLNECDLLAPAEKSLSCNVEKIIAGKYPIRELNFVKTFLKELVDYRQEMELVDISNELLIEFYNNFIKDRLDELKKEYKKNNLLGLSLSQD